MKKSSQLQAVILSAGKGKRLHPITLNHSKAMTPILGVPIIQRIISVLANCGLKRFVVVRAPQDQELEELMRKLAEELGLEIKTALQHQAKGTADALNSARNLIESDFLLTSCDNLYPDLHFQNLLDCFFEKNACAVLTLSRFKPKDLNKSAGVRLQGDEIIDLKEKPGENSGPWDAISKFLFVLDKKVLDFLEQVPESERGEREIQTAIKMMIDQLGKEKKPRGVFVSRYLHLTSAQDLIEIHNHYLANHKPYSVHPEAELEEGVKLIEPVMIEKGVVIKKGSCIGPFVYIGAGSLLEEEVSLEQVVVYPNSYLPRGTVKKNQVIISENSS